MKAIVTMVTSAFAGLLIGGFLSLVGVGGSLSANLLISLCAGLCISAAAEAVDSATAGRSLRLRLASFALAVGLGSLPPVAVGLLVLQPQGADQIRDAILKVVMISLVFGATLTAIFILLRRRQDLTREVEALELRQSEAERRRLEAHLLMLQAQIEPHFLFNTLATLSSLIETDAPLARSLLDKLVLYLRATLSRVRSDGGTLGDELDLVHAYLDICRVRLGSRLSYAVEVPPSLRRMPFPAMLVQPLVENAVKHGVEAKPGPVRVSLVAEEAGDRLRVSVQDDGLGLGQSQGGGFGLENVRARLDSAYGAAAKFRLEENPTGGVCATIEVPTS